MPLAGCFFGINTDQLPPELALALRLFRLKHESTQLLGPRSRRLPHSATGCHWPQPPRSSPHHLPDERQHLISREHLAIKTLTHPERTNSLTSGKHTYPPASRTTAIAGVFARGTIILLVLPQPCSTFSTTRLCKFIPGALSTAISSSKRINLSKPTCFREAAEEQYRQQAAQVPQYANDQTAPVPLGGGERHFDPTKSKTLKAIQEQENQRDEFLGYDFFDKVANAEAPRVPQSQVFRQLS